MSSHIEHQYLTLLSRLVEQYRYNESQPNRTGVDIVKIPPILLQHNMSDGFPILTTKKVAWKTLKVELEGFIQGITSKKWYQERGCKIWNEWCNPQKVPYGNDEETKAKMAAEDDLGPCLYGASWRDFHDPNAIDSHGVDQFKKVVDTLESNPYDRRMLCVAWNPLGLNHTALPACHVLWQVAVRGDVLDLVWYQRSVDTMLGLPFNLASYALLLHLLAKESGLKAGYVTGFLMDCHLYENHISAAREQLSRVPYDLPQIETENFTSIFDWTHKDSKLVDYKSHDAIKAEVAV